MWPSWQNVTGHPYFWQMGKGGKKDTQSNLLLCSCLQTSQPFTQLIPYLLKWMAAALQSSRKGSLPNHTIRQLKPHCSPSLPHLSLKHLYWPLKWAQKQSRGFDLLNESFCWILMSHTTVGPPFKQGNNWHSHPPCTQALMQRHPNDYSGWRCLA